ncbi:ketopantoate reductase family protein [Sessilibacter corallicola]|uniref:2-dehydropantoate 2-reductase n=1 Tax=Sessilibacter corallicola TaxID=2904075 RepID=A0ABQ0ACT8_9GAMM
MNIVIWGAGGIGCYYGSRLINAGANVTFVARGKHLQALQAHGLTVKHPEFTFNGSVNAVDEATWLTQSSPENTDLVILCLKSTATGDALLRAKRWLQASQCYVLSLQNGVDNENQLCDIIESHRVLGGLAVRIGAHITQPGHIEATGIAKIIFGAWPNHSRQHHKSYTGHEFCQQLKILFTQALIDNHLNDNIQKEIWKKLLINAGVNPISALTELDTQTLTSDNVFSATVYQLMQETARAAHADGVEISSSDIDAMFELICGFDAIKTSMLVDFENRKPLELDAISGAVIQRCRSLNSPAYTTELIDQLLKTKINKCYG